ncbi:hypothetical protein NMG60_11014581 [Bertholletia excelsa]
MVMDPRFTGSSDSVNGLYLDDIFPNYHHQPENLFDKFKFKDDSMDLNFMDIPPLSPDPNAINVASTSSISFQVDSPDDGDQSDPFLKYINSVLLEDNMEEKSGMFYDPLALQATEKSLYDIIGHKYPASPNQPPLHLNSNIESSDDYRFNSSSEHSTNSNTVRSNSVESQWITDPGGQGASVQSYPFQYFSEPILQTNSTWSFGSMNTFSNGVNGPVDSSLDNHLFSSIITDGDFILQYKKGLEEASKFLPSKAQLFIDLESYAPPKSKSAPTVAAKVDNERAYRPSGLRGRKNHDREDGSLDEERSSKQLASYEKDDELSEMFDRVLLFTNSEGQSPCFTCDEVQSEETRISHQNVQLDGRGSGKTRIEKEGDEKEVVDLRTLLLSCAQSLAADDRRSANEQLKHIRHHSSPTGTASQRLAHVFANGLEARLAGTGSQIYASLASQRISAAQKLKAYQVFLPVSPFMKMSIFFATKMIADLALKFPNKRLHIIDFGIQYGFQWPILIKYLSELLPDGAPEQLRITGIDYPQSGFRPAELIEETGRRLAKYCERFKVPFRYNALAVQKWERIKIEDLHIDNDEVIVVNCLARLKNLHDETVADDSPRDTVLKLIRKIHPNIFIQSEVSGSYASPFFVTRFREALFHYSSLFDLIETNIDGEDEERINFEQEFLGREIMNVVACEGLERVETPETYRQWQVRIARAGFKILPLDQELLKKLRGKVRAEYHKNFTIDEHGEWMLQGWKGRIFSGSFCWVPA